MDAVDELRQRQRKNIVNRHRQAPGIRQRYVKVGNPQQTTTSRHSRRYDELLPKRKWWCRACSKARAAPVDHVEQFGGVGIVQDLESDPARFCVPYHFRKNVPNIRPDPGCKRQAGIAGCDHLTPFGKVALGADI
jgi:hypothetical protein